MDPPETMNPEKRLKASRVEKAKQQAGAAEEGRTPEEAEEIEELSELVQQQAEEIQAKEQQIELTAEVQKSLLPERMPDIAGFELAASYFAPEKAGGDYFDFLPLEREADHRPNPDGRWVVIVADAAGHGPSATVVMAMLHSLLHAFPGPHDEPGRIMEFINRQMCRKDLAGMFATAVLAILDPLQRCFHYSCAGHPPPLMRKARGGVVELAAGHGPGLAVKPEARFESQRLHLQPLDALLLYTDGLIEAPDASGAPFGIERLGHVFDEAGGSARQMVDVINRVVADYRGFEEQPDDKTFIVIRAREPAETRFPANEINLG